jgi:hypothetical protein
MFYVYMARASTAIGVSPTIKETVQKQAHSTLIDRRRSVSDSALKEVILMRMLAVDRLEDSARQELANQVHQMQVQGEI